MARVHTVSRLGRLTSAIRYLEERRLRDLSVFKHAVELDDRAAGLPATPRRHRMASVLVEEKYVLYRSRARWTDIMTLA
jgi:hypothetical protein